MIMPAFGAVLITHLRDCAESPVGTLLLEERNDIMSRPILVVDDEGQVRSLVTRLLSRQGFQTIEAADGPSALSAARDQDGNIAVLISDIEMAPMNGVELAKALRSEFPSLPVLFMSAGAVSLDTLRRDIPDCGLVRKPFEATILIQSVRARLREGA